MDLFKLFGTNTIENLNNFDTEKDLDKFVKNTFKRYIRDSDVLKRYAKIYDNESSYKDECNELYILTEKLFQNVIKKVKVPIDIKYGPKGSSYKNKSLYIFDLKDYMEEFERVFPDMKKLRGTQEYMDNLQDYFEGLASKQNEGISII